MKGCMGVMKNLLRHGISAEAWDSWDSWLRRFIESACSLLRWLRRLRTRWLSRASAAVGNRGGVCEWFFVSSLMNLMRKARSASWPGGDTCVVVLLGMTKLDPLPNSLGHRAAWSLSLSLHLSPHMRRMTSDDSCTACPAWMPSGGAWESSPRRTMEIWIQISSRNLGAASQVMKLRVLRSEKPSTWIQFKVMEGPSRFSRCSIGSRCALTSLKHLLAASLLTLISENSSSCCLRPPVKRLTFRAWAPCGSLLGIRPSASSIVAPSRRCCRGSGAFC